MNPGIGHSKATSDDLSVVVQIFVVFVRDYGNFAMPHEVEIIDVQMTNESRSQRPELLEKFRLVSENVILIHLKCSRIEQAIPYRGVAWRDRIQQGLRIRAQLRPGLIRRLRLYGSSVRAGEGY